MTTAYLLSVIISKSILLEKVLAILRLLSFRENYVYIVIIGQDMIGLNKSVKPETLVDTFQKIELE